MPYRQKKKYVHKAIKSVLAQTYKKFELIIVFDDEKKDDLNFIKLITKNNTLRLSIASFELITFILFVARIEKKELKSLLQKKTEALA